MIQEQFNTLIWTSFKDEGNDVWGGETFLFFFRWQTSWVNVCLFVRIGDGGWLTCVCVCLLIDASLTVFTGALWLIGHKQTHNITYTICTHAHSGVHGGFCGWLETKTTSTDCFFPDDYPPLTPSAHTHKIGQHYSYNTCWSKSNWSFVFRRCSLDFFYYEVILNSEQDTFLCAATICNYHNKMQLSHSCFACCEDLYLYLHVLNTNIIKTHIHFIVWSFWRLQSVLM